jgi:hypothetical protein
VDEILSSPLTNVQQVAARGNPAWVWTLEYVDLTDDERDVVQAFLMRCRGSLNTFKVPDFGDYGIRGAMSDWVDLFSGEGEFVPLSPDSFFTVNSQFDYNVNEDRSIALEWRTHVSTESLKWKGHGTVGAVDSLEAGKAYVQRIQHYQHPDRVVHEFGFSVNSGNYSIQDSAKVHSSDSITKPFVTGALVTSIDTGINDGVRSGGIGDAWSYANYQLKRCGLVVNTENLLTRSNDFAHADWTAAANVNIESGWMDASPLGITSGGWKLYGDNSTNTETQISQAYTKPMTEDMYAAEIYAQAAEHERVMIELQDSSFANESRVIFDLNLGALEGTVSNFGVHDEGYATLTDVGSGIYRCLLRAKVSSLNNITVRYYVVNSDGQFQFTNNGSAGIHIFGASLRRFPFSGPYHETVASNIVGTEWQTGSKVMVAGLDPEDVIKAGQRFEIVNRFHSQVNSQYERTEFKRVTKEVKVHREGHALIEFDPPIRNAPETIRDGEITVDNPVIFHQPEIKARLVAGTIQYVDKAIKTTDINFDIVEDMTE